MRFARVGEAGAEIPVVVHEDRLLDLRPLTSDVNGGFLKSEPVATTSRAISRGQLPLLDWRPYTRFGAPIARPSAVLCVGMNYVAHAAESGSPPPTTPVLFLKTPNTVAGPNDPVTIPRGSEKTDWEVELGVVIGRRASYLDSPGQSMGHVAGFVAAHDVSERTFQLEVSGGQWSKGKCSPGFTPIGPWLVTPDEVDHRALGLRSSVNGQVRQDSTTADMIFSVEQIVWHLSQFVTLEPGDLLLTGTPEGVALSGRYPFLRPGDVVEIEVTGLGRQRQQFRAWERL
ncbi:fumarylacetoacetate hydrolase family protein [Microbacterium sp. NPDC057407]|uniref:fumarylacetoacetate hydrolase family protein n=1 Tax=Microbacterium sp. NPDC057407 TaxID=3346120 RepID=UPI003672F73A